VGIRAEFEDHVAVATRAPPGRTVEARLDERASHPGHAGEERLEELEDDPLLRQEFHVLRVDIDVLMKIDGDRGISASSLE